MSDYTPSTSTVRQAWYEAPYNGGGGREMSDAELDRWLESIRAEERERIVRDIEVAMRRHDRAQVGFSAIGDAYADAARIVREGA